PPACDRQLRLGVGRAADGRSLPLDPGDTRNGAAGPKSGVPQLSPFDPASERRLVIIADWLPPDFGAVGPYMQIRARSPAERGHDVTLVGLSSTDSSVKHESVSAGTLTELRLAAKPVPRNSLLGRLLWTM